MADFIVEDEEEMIALRDRDADFRFDMEREEKAWTEYLRECEAEDCLRGKESDYK